MFADRIVSYFVDGVWSIMRISSIAGFAIALSTTSLPGQPPVASNAQPTTEWSQKDQSADDERSRNDRRFMGVIVRLVPSSTVTWRSAVLGKEVQAEGVAFRGRVIMDNSDIRVEGERIDLDDEAYKGRLVRVTGTLRYSGGSQSRFGNTAPYFHIDPMRCKIVDRVVWPS